MMLRKYPLIAEKHGWIPTTPTTADKGLTKKGLPRKRSARTVNKKSKQQRQQDKHPLKNACDEINVKGSACVKY